MALGSTAVALVLLAAFLHAGWNAMVKGAADRTSMFIGISLCGSLMSAIGALFLPLPHPDSWWFLAASTVIHYAYYLFLMNSYRLGDLSQVYPVARGSAPLLVAVGGYFFANESLAPVGLLAVAVTSLGIMMLAFEKGVPRGDQKKPLLFAMATGLMIATYTVVDGMGVRRSGNALSYILWLFALEGIPFLIWVLAWRRQRFLGYVRKNWHLVLAGGVATELAYGLVIFALSLGAMASVSALRETSTILATIIGAVVLKERFGKGRYVAASLVAVGVVVLNGCS